MDFPNNEKYTIIEILGQGAFGCAYKELNKDDLNFYVIKKITLKEGNKEELEKIKNEAKILSTLDNSHIVKYYESFEDNSSFNIVMEYCEGLDLRKYINDHKNKLEYIDKNIIYHILSDICSGLKEIHDKNLIHRDLKPENLFLTRDFKIKIGDFGISRQLDSENKYAQTQVGTLLYMAPEIIEGKKYTSKVDIWSLGCILYELCTLNNCFISNSLKDIMEKICSAKYENIDIKLYGEDLQLIINTMLTKDHNKRSSIDEIRRIINKSNCKWMTQSIVELFEEDKSYQNYIIEKNIQKSLEKINLVILSRESKFHKMKISGGAFIVSIIASFTGGIGALIISMIFLSFFNIKYNYFYEKRKFISDNNYVINVIQSKLIEKIKNKLDSKIKREKIIIFNDENFNNKIEKIKSILISGKFLEKLKKIIAKNFNILLVGNTNVGKSTLINEFLKLDATKKAKESDGGPTNTKDFSPYVGINNKYQYTLYDTNGITNIGNDSVDNKIKNTLSEIEKRIQSNDPNQLIHCIWYCFQGTNIQPSDKLFIEKLLKIYTNYSIPIIYVHTQTFSKSQSKTCKKGINKYLKEIYNGDEVKVKEQLNNYINVLARSNVDNNNEDEENEENEEDEEEDEKEQKVKAFGLDKLEIISKKEIEIKGFKSSYYEFIKRTIIPILINGIFTIIFTDHNIDKLTSKSLKDLNEYLKELLDIINDDKLKLSEEIKNNNEESLKKLYNSFNDNKNDIINELKNSLTINNLKKENESLFKQVYDEKSENYKSEMNYNDFCSNLENLILDNLSSNKTKVINNLINICFNDSVIEIIKEGIQEQFKEKEEQVLQEIYSELFKNK